MEPIINPMVFYWIDVLCGLNLFFIVTAILFLIGTGVIIGDCIDSKQSVKDSRFVKVFFAISVFSLFAVAIIPSESTMYKMIAANYVTVDAVNAGIDIVDKVVDKIVSMI